MLIKHFQASIFGVNKSKGRTASLSERGDVICFLFACWVHLG